MKKFLLFILIIIFYSSFSYAKRTGCEGDCENGNGTYKYDSGNKYEGEWFDGRQHGEGDFIWKNGNKYEGEWLDGRQHGKGVFIWKNGDKYEGSVYFNLDNYPVEHHEDVLIVFRIIKKVYLGWKSTAWRNQNGKACSKVGIIENYDTACTKNNFECLQTSVFSLDKGSPNYHAELDRIALKLKELISGNTMKPISTSIKPTSPALQVKTLPGKYHGKHVTVNFIDGDQKITEIGLTLYSLLLSKMITIVVGGTLTGTLTEKTKKKTQEGSVSMYVVKDLLVENVSIYAPVKENFGKLIPNTDMYRALFEDVMDVSLARLVNFRVQESLHMTIKADGAAKPVDAGLFLKAMRGIGEPVNGKEFDITNAKEETFDKPECVWGMLHL